MTHRLQVAIVTVLAIATGSLLGGYSLAQYTTTGMTPFYDERPMSHELRVAEDPAADDPWPLDTGMAKAAYHASDHWKPSAAPHTS